MLYRTSLNPKGVRATEFTPQMQERLKELWDLAYDNVSKYPYTGQNQELKKFIAVKFGLPAPGKESVSMYSKEEGESLKKNVEAQAIERYTKTEGDLEKTIVIEDGDPEENTAQQSEMQTYPGSLVEDRFNTTEEQRLGLLRAKAKSAEGLTAKERAERIVLETKMQGLLARELPQWEAPSGAKKKGAGKDGGDGEKPRGPLSLEERARQDAYPLATVESIQSQQAREQTIIENAFNTKFAEQEIAERFPLSAEEIAARIHPPHSLETRNAIERDIEESLERYVKPPVRVRQSTEEQTRRSAEVEASASPLEIQRALNKTTDQLNGVKERYNKLPFYKKLFSTEATTLQTLMQELTDQQTRLEQRRQEASPRRNSTRSETGIPLQLLRELNAEADKEEDLFQKLTRLQDELKKSWNPLRNRQIRSDIDTTERLIRLRENTKIATQIEKNRIRKAS